MEEKPRDEDTENALSTSPKEEVQQVNTEQTKEKNVEERLRRMEELVARMENENKELKGDVELLGGELGKARQKGEDLEFDLHKKDQERKRLERDHELVVEQGRNMYNYIMEEQSRGGRVPSTPGQGQAYSQSQSTSYDRHLPYSQDARNMGLHESMKSSSRQAPQTPRPGDQSQYYSEVFSDRTEEVNPEQFERLSTLREGSRENDSMGHENSRLKELKKLSKSNRRMSEVDQERERMSKGTQREKDQLKLEKEKRAELAEEAKTHKRFENWVKSHENPTPGMIDFYNKKDANAKIVTPLEFFANKRLENHGTAEILWWYETKESYCQIGPRHASLWETEWHNTVSDKFVVHLFNFNYEDQEKKRGSNLHKGRVFSKHDGTLEERMEITPGFTLERKTKLTQLDRRAFEILVRLMATPTDINKFQNSIIDRIGKQFKGGDPGLRDLEGVSPLNVLSQFSLVEKYVSVILEAYESMKELVSWAKHTFNEDDAYKKGLKVLYGGDNGLHKLLIHLFNEHGSQWMIQWMDDEQIKSKKYRECKKEGGDVDDLVEPAKSIHAELENFMDYIRNFRKIGKETRDLMKANKPEKVVLQSTSKRKPKTTPSLSNLSLNVLESVADDACEGDLNDWIDELQLPDWRDMTREQLDWCAGWDAEMENVDFEMFLNNVNLSAFPSHDKARPATGNLYDHKEPRKKIGQDWLKAFCFHRIFGTDCTEKCVGKDNPSFVDGWLAARWLRNQNIDNVAKASKNRELIERFMDKAERIILKAGQTVPDGGFRGRTAKDAVQPDKKSGGKPRREAPPRPRDDDRNRGQANSNKIKPHPHGPRREDKLTKKHQYSDMLKEMEVEDQDALLAAMFGAPRFQELFSLSDDGKEFLPDEDAEFFYTPINPSE